MRGRMYWYSWVREDKYGGFVGEEGGGAAVPLRLVAAEARGCLAIEYVVEHEVVTENPQTEQQIEHNKRRDIEIILPRLVIIHCPHKIIHANLNHLEHHHHNYITLKHLHNTISDITR
jgi:hypothetical protein